MDRDDSGASEGVVLIRVVESVRILLPTICCRAERRAQSQSDSGPESDVMQRRPYYNSQEHA